MNPRFSITEQFKAIANQPTEITNVGKLAILQSYDRFIRQYPDYVAAYQNRSALLQQLGLYQLALQDAEKVAELAPDFALGHCNKAFLLNLFGQYEQGWAEYEWRWKTDVETFADPGWGIPRWQGEALNGKRLLIYAEQGLGDNIQFVRLAIAAQQLGLDPIVVNHSSVENLLNANLARYGVETASNGSALANLGWHCAMMSLPHRLNLRLDNIPFADGYLQAQPEFIAKWQVKLTACSPTRSKPRIGVVWAGSAKHNRNQIRSLQFSQFSKLFELDAQFHCLQKIVSEQDFAQAKTIKNLHFWHNEIEDFSDTAALVEQMDLVISVDTSVAHLAGAMGKPTWILISYHPDFRWLLNRTDSPWYKSVRLYRQDSEQHWETVVQQIYQQLQTQFQLNSF